MVADKVELETLSAEPGAEAVLWSCTGGGTYSLAPSSRRRVGTTVTLHLSAEGAEFSKTGGSRASSGSTRTT
jgi:molecular chaperone HtpG